MLTACAGLDTVNGTFVLKSLVFTTDPPINGQLIFECRSPFTTLLDRCKLSQLSHSIILILDLGNSPC